MCKMVGGIADLTEWNVDRQTDRQTAFQFYMYCEYKRVKTLILCERVATINSSVASYKTSKSSYRELNLYRIK